MEEKHKAGVRKKGRPRKFESQQALDVSEI
jgi:hypothetical protein